MRKRRSGQEDGMGRRWIVPGIVLLLGWAPVRSAPPPSAPAKSPAPPKSTPEKTVFAQKIVPFLSAYCTSCHGGAKPKGGLALDKYRDEAAALKDRRVWE